MKKIRLVILKPMHILFTLGCLNLSRAINFIDKLTNLCYILLIRISALWMPSVIAWQYSPVRTQNAQDCLCCYDAYYQFSSQLVKLPHYTMKTLHNTHSARTREWVKHVPHVRCSEMGFFVDANLYKTKQVKKLRRLNCLIQILILVLLIILPKQASYALPEVDTVVSGQAEVTYPNTATLQINSTDAKTIINYKSFNIAENESVVVNMPSADSAVLNRVLGGGLSEILGKLSSNGIFILINPNGIHIGPKVEINVASMIASTRDITNSDFLSANYVFSKLNDIEKEALLLNEGKINVLQGGFVSLIGAAVENKGAILCPLGTISLAAGDKVTLGITGNSLISVAIDLPTSSKVYDASGRPVTEQVKNSGTLQADGGMILINAESIPGIFEKAINLDGYVRANQVETHEGSIKLTTNGKVSASSTLLAKNIEFYSKNGISLFNSALNDGLVNLTGENINITYLATANLTLKTDNAINTTPGVIIEANQVRVIAKQFGTQEVPLHINANLTYINRTAGNIDILESTGLGTSIMLRGPPGGFGAIIYNRDTELTLDAAKISLIGPDSIHLYGNITFSNLECIIPAKEIYFEAGKTYTILGEFKVLGAYAQHIKLLSSEQDKQWYINPQGSRDLVYTWVQDSYNLGTEIVMTLSTNRGNCFAWDPVITWGGGVGNWNVGSNWVGGVAPGAGDDAVISGGTCTVTANASIVNLTVASGATLSINNARTLTVTGDLSLNGTISGAGALTMSGAAGKTLSGAGSFTSTGIFTINTGAKTLSNGSNLSIRNLTVTGVTLTNNGTLTVSSALAGTGGLTQGVGAVLNISGTSTITTLTATASPNTVNYNGAAQTVKAVTYYNLTLSGSGAKTLTGLGTINGDFTLSGTCTATTAAAMTIGGNLSVGSGTTLTVAGFAFTVNGTTSVSGTLAHSAAAGAKTHIGLVTINAGGSWTNTGNSAFTFRGGLTNNGTFTAGTGVYTFDTNNQALNGTIAIPNLTVTGVTLTNNGTLTVSSALAGTGGLTQGVGAVLNISGTSTITTLTATASPNTVNYNGAAQTVKAVTYYNLTISTAGIKTLGGNITVSGALTVSAGTLTPAGFTVNGTPGGTLSVTGTIQADKANFTDTYIGFGTITLNAGSTIDYNGAMPQTIDNTLSYQNLTASGTANKTTAGTINVSGTFTITSVTVTNNGTLTVSSALAGTGGLTQGVGAVLNISGTSTITTLTATASPNTVNYNGAAQTVKAVTYHHLTTSGSGTKTLGGNTAINGDLLINSGTALTIGAFTSTVTGQTTINGTINITSTTGTKTFVGMVTIGSGGIWNTSANEAITFRGGLTYNGTTFTPGTGVYTFDTNNQTIGGNNAIAIPNLTVTGVTLTNNGTLTVSSALAGTGGLTQGVGAVLNISGTSTITTLTATASPNTVNYNGAAQTVKAVTYYNLTLSGSGAKALASGTSVTNSLSIAPTGSAIANIGAGLTISVNNLVLGGLGRINGTWGSTTSTATYQDNTYFTATTGKLSVITDTRSTPTATLSTTNSPVTYNGSAQSATVGITTSSVPGSVANILLDGAANQTNAGTYAVTADFIPTDITSYKSLTGLSAGNFTINKAPLSITANNKNKTYGDTVTFTGTEFSSAGLQNLETIGNVALVSAGAISTASVASSPYTITPSNATGGTFNTNNYNITYINGSLTVNKADLTITANDQAKTYGETFTFTGNEFTSNGLRNLESIGSVTLNSLGAPGTASTGTYPIIPSAATGGTFNSSNYNIAYMNGTLDIKAAPQPPKNNTITNGALEIYLIVKHIEDQRTKWNLANIFGRKITVFQNINSLKGLGIIFIPQEGTTIFSSY